MFCGSLVLGDTRWEKVLWSNKFGKHCVLSPFLEVLHAHYTKTLRSHAVKKLIELSLIQLPGDVSQSKQLPPVILTDITSN